MPTGNCENAKGRESAKAERPDEESRKPGSGRFFSSGFPGFLIENPSPSVSRFRASCREPIRTAAPRRSLAGLWIASLGLYLFALLPLLAILLRVSPALLLRHLREPVVRQALALSLGTSVAATALCVLLGLPAAYLLARQRFPGREALDTLADLPITVPPVVAGVGLLLLFGRMGLLGRYFEAAGIRIAFTPLAVVLAQAFVAIPFFTKAARAGFRALDPELEQVALTLGADRWQTWRWVTLPLCRPGLLAGVTLAWARAMSEFGATLMFAGNLPGRTQTLPLAVMTAMDVDLDTALALSAITLAVAGAALLLAKWLLGGEEVEW